MKDRFHCVEGCTRCCTDKGSPLELTLGDIVRLSRVLKASPKELFLKYCEIIWNRIPDTSLFIPSIGLVFPCLFLKESKCVVYDVRPIHCRLFPEALITESGNTGVYRNCGYLCIDRGVALPTDRKVYVNRLKEVDKYELRSTAEHFENFKYCVSLAPERLAGTEKTIASIPREERASHRRKMITESIGKKEREEVKAFFLKKLGNIGKKVLEGSDPLSLLSSNFRILMQ